METSIAAGQPLNPPAGSIAVTGCEMMGAAASGTSAPAQGHGFAPRPAVTERHKAMLTAAGSPFTASMLRDVENGLRTEVDHVIGDLLVRGKGGDYPVLKIAHAHLKAYEARRARTTKI